jgi:Raf kinase inhibitor-like YbhB/YbcL family protein
MNIKSKSFLNNAILPVKYTCDGEGINPPLEFDEVPDETKSLALIVDDPDVPKSLKSDGVFDHWLVWNIPGHTTQIEEGKSPVGSIIGKNGAGENTFAGACPPDTSHRYFFKLYALDTDLSLNKDKTTKEDLLKHMEAHIIAQAQLVAVYERPDSEKTM